MASIMIMCSSEACPHRRGCLRHEATPKKFGQASAHFAPDANGSCKDFVPLKVARYLNQTTAA
jgi:hypothetical protein